MRLSLVVLVFLYATGMRGAEYERLLVPISVVLASGAFGTVWTTQAAAVQELETPVEIVGDMSLDVPWGIGGSQPYRVFPLPSEDAPPGAIMYIPRAAAEEVHVSARLLLQRNTVVVDETNLPIVSDVEFTTSTLYFLQLVHEESERVHLRVYSLDVDHPQPNVRVRVQATWVGSLAGWSVVYDEVHALHVQQQFRTPASGGTPVPLRPLGTQFSLDPVFSTLPLGARVAISVVSAAPDLRVWAMVSETNNVTQRVRLAIPD